MKKLFQLVIMCFTVLMLSACGTDGSESDEGIQIVESEPLDMAVSAEGEKAEDAENRAPGDNAAEPETDAETADLWTGEYNDRDVNEPNRAYLTSWNTGNCILSQNLPSPDQRSPSPRLHLM